MAEFANIPRPNGKTWEARRKAVLARNPRCVYCGRVPYKPVVAHVIPLAEGVQLAIPTTSLSHPLNSPDNLTTACDWCNNRAGASSIPTARRRIAEKLGRDVYDGPVPDTARVQAMLDELSRRPAARSKPLTTTAPAKTPEKPAPARLPWSSIAEYVRDNEYPAGSGQLTDAEKNELWSVAHLLDCLCAEADGSRCFICLPV